MHLGDWQWLNCDFQLCNKNDSHCLISNGCGIDTVTSCVIKTMKMITEPIIRAYISVFIPAKQRKSASNMAQKTNKSIDFDILYFHNTQSIFFNLHPTLCLFRYVIEFLFFFFEFIIKGIKFSLVTFFISGLYHNRHPRIESSPSIFAIQG